MIPKELRDQSAHIGIVLIALIPAAKWPNPLTFTWAGFCLGLLAEVKEEGNPVTLAKLKAALRSRRDLTFYALAGLFIGITFAK